MLQAVKPEASFFWRKAVFQGFQNRTIAENPFSTGPFHAIIRIIGVRGER